MQKPELWRSGAAPSGAYKRQMGLRKWHGGGGVGQGWGKGTVEEG